MASKLTPQRHTALAQPQTFLRARLAKQPETLGGLLSCQAIFRTGPQSGTDSNNCGDTETSRP